MKRLTNILIPILTLAVLISCKKEEINNQEQEMEVPTIPTGEFTPDLYDDYLPGKWYIDTVVYTSGNNPNHSDAVDYGAGEYYEFSKPPGGGSIVSYDWDNSTIMDPTYIGEYWRVSLNTPDHYHITLFGGMNFYIQYMSYERMEWLINDPYNEGTTDTRYIYLHRSS